MNLVAKLRFLARISYRCCLDNVGDGEEDLCGGRRLADKAMFVGSGLNGRRSTKYFRLGFELWKMQYEFRR